LSVSQHCHYSKIVHHPGIRFVDQNWPCGDWEFFTWLFRWHPCGYLDIETSLNRSHGDAVRLTDKSPVVLTKNRLSLIKSVWKADAEFYERQQEEVDRVERQQVISFVECLLMDSEVREARKYLRKLKNHRWENDIFKILLLFLLAYVPGGHRLLALFR
jgi:hypothetical protein